MNWFDHIQAIGKRVRQRLSVLRRVKYLLPLHGRLTIYNSLILPLFDYSDLVWGDKNNETLMQHLQVLQNNAARIILNLPKCSSGTQARNLFNWTTLAPRRRQHRCIAIFKCLNEFADYDFSITRNEDIYNHNIRSRQDLHLLRVRTNWGKQRFVYHAASEWNNLDSELRQASSLTVFKNLLLL